MEIQKRSSQGRGEYELSGTSGLVTLAQLQNLPISVDTGGSLGRLRTNINLKFQGGKPRLRQVNRGTGDIHLHRQVEALLVMPKSIRDEQQLIGGEPVLLAARYILRRIAIKDVKAETSEAIMQFGLLDCGNDSATANLEFGARLAAVEELYTRAGELPERVGRALLAHKADILGAGRVSLSTEHIVEEICKATEEALADSELGIIPGEDPVPALLNLLQIENSILSAPSLDQVDPEDMFIRRGAAERWRIIKDKGPRGVTFKKKVRAAYNSTCIVCGLCLPAAEGVTSPGVDAAHILPWASYDADVVKNGICLCKFHHWAFDQYLIALTQEEDDRYRITVTSLAVTAYGSLPGVLAELKKHAGYVSEDRLPAKKSERPSKLFLSQLYSDVCLPL